MFHIRVGRCGGELKWCEEEEGGVVGGGWLSGFWRRKESYVLFVKGSVYWCVKGIK